MSYRLEIRELQTIESIRRGAGGVTRMLKEAKVEIESDDGNSLRISGGSPVVVAAEESGRALVPTDFESLVLLSFYDHLEESVDFFRSHGVDVDVLLPIQSIISPELGVTTTLNGFTDNAAYAPGAHAFLLPDSFLLKREVPLACNEGVVAHELSHAVFHFLLNGENRIPREYEQEWGLPPVRTLAAINEGVADLFAGMRLQDPDFIAPSLGGLSIDRAMNIERQYTEDMQSAIEAPEDEDAELLGLGFSPYDVGSVFAAAGWTVAETFGADIVTGATVRSLQTLSTHSTYAPEFALQDFLNIWVDEFTNASEHSAACDVIVQRFELIQSELVSCP